MTRQLTKKEFEMALPKQLKLKVDQTFLDNVNNVIQDEDVREAFLDNMITYSSVLKEGRFRLDQYVNAIRYVSFKMYGDTNLGAYIKTFPDKYQKWVDEGKPDNHINAYVTAFKNSKLVMSILEQAMIPTHLLNAHHFQNAINVQAQIMSDEDVSPKVRSDAANSLLTHLKAPETKKIELDIGHKPSSAIEELQDTMSKLAQQQKSILEGGGMNAQQLAHSRIIEGEKLD